MNLIKDYESSESDHEKLVKKIKTIQNPINLAPNADISTLQAEKNQAKMDDIDKIYPAKSKPNHLTGQADLYHMNTFNFEEQYHNFKNLGYAYDPTDGPDQKIIINNSLSNISKDAIGNTQSLISRSVFGSSKIESEQRKIYGKNRKKTGTAGSGDYLGPWAGYDNEDKYNSEIISVEQKEILNRIEEKRQKKMEEQKQQTTNEVFFFKNFSLMFHIFLILVST